MLHSDIPDVYEIQFATQGRQAGKRVWKVEQNFNYSNGFKVGAEAFVEKKH